MNGALWLLPLFAVGYALWAFFRLRRMERNEPADGIVAEDTPCRQEMKTRPAGRRSSAGAALSSTRATPGHKLP